MPFFNKFLEDGKGLLQYGSGVVVIAEVLRCNQELVDSPDKTAGLTYGIVDLTEVTNLEINSTDIRAAANVGKQVILAPGAKVAIIAPSDYAFGISRMWEVFVEPAGWRTKVFREKDGAIAWVRIDTD